MTLTSEGWDENQVHMKWAEIARELRRIFGARHVDIINEGWERITTEEEIEEAPDGEPRKAFEHDF